MPSVSLIVIARNEEANIGRCLRSVGFADEIVVVDNGSTDKTIEIAARFNARVISAPDWRGFGRQKNRALDAASCDWILSLDADEWIERELADEIKSAIASPNGFDGFEIPRRSRFCGQVVKHCGWSPDYILRLFRRGSGRFSNRIVHERVEVSGSVGRLSAPIEHDSIANLDEAHEKMGRYAAAAAEELVARGASASIPRALLKANWAFFQTYIVRRGFLDGSVGTMVAMYNAIYTYQKWARVAAAATEARPQILTLGTPEPRAGAE
jgi:glycosyltransferase involved in cell wall biosynthesis